MPDGAGRFAPGSAGGRGEGGGRCFGVKRGHLGAEEDKAESGPGRGWISDNSATEA